RPGRPVDAHLLANEGKPVYRVRIFAEGRLAEVRLDPGSGKLLEGLGDDRPASSPHAEPAFTDVFRVAADEWASEGRNAWVPLEPGTVLVLEGKEEGRPARLTLGVLAETKKIDGVETRVVEERQE